VSKLRPRRAYVATAVSGGTIQTHYRSAGEGPPLLMLHPSPLDSGFLVPVMEAVGPAIQCLALDTPGYGASDPLPTLAEDLAPYVEWLAAVQDVLGLSSSGLYGSATGAQIAIEFARSHPDRVDWLVLENAAHFEPDEVERIMDGYFPDLSPQPDGSHLAATWAVAEALFSHFPWYEASASDSGKPPPPVEVIHAITMAYQQAGPDYARAYRAAFRNEDARRVQAIRKPVAVIRWAGSILKPWSDRYDDFEWSDNVRMVHCGLTLEERYAALGRTVRGFALADHGEGAAPTG
jgi:pimeloyl-ACP methyl ester carboxylesterase